MILENVKPLLIINYPTKNLLFGSETIGGIVNFVKESTSGWVTDWVVRRTSNTQGSGTIRVPIPFYFYERLADVKSNEDLFTGFLLDSCVENIDLAYPDTPTTQIVTDSGTNQPTLALNDALMIKNTIEVGFRVKNNSTLVSIFRAMMKRLVTDTEVAKNTRFSWYWRTFILTDAKLLDYNEAPVGNTDLTLIKMKFLHAVEDEKKSTSGSVKPFTKKPEMVGIGVPVA